MTKKACCNCVFWAFEGNNWGHCVALSQSGTPETLVHSFVMVANTQPNPFVPEGESTMWWPEDDGEDVRAAVATPGDFYCAMFQRVFCAKKRRHDKTP